MSSITTHVLDAVLGKPASAINVQVEKHFAGSWIVLGQSVTDSNGRCRNLCPDASEGRYRIVFAVESYFASHGRKSIFPEIAVTLLVNGEHQYHIPLLLSDNSYTTYRGS
jgi:5-hydroxyisourate hydrolase